MFILVNLTQTYHLSSYLKLDCKAMEKNILIIFMKSLLPSTLQSQVRSTVFVEYMWKEVLPVLDQIESTLTESGTQGAHILDLLKIIAELTPHAGNLEDVPGKVLVVYERLLVSPGACFV